MSNSDVKRLLRKRKLSGKEAALLIIRSTWEEQKTGKGFLSDTEMLSVKASIRPGQLALFNDYWELYQSAWFSLLDAGRLGLTIAAACGRLYPLIIAYGSERRLGYARSRLPHVVTAKEYEERRLAQREDKLLEPVSLGHVLNWYMPQDELASEQLLQEAESFEKDVSENEQTYYEGMLAYVLGEEKEPELARPWLEWLLEMLRGGRLNPVYYTEEASERAHGYLPSSSDYASIYQEQSERPGAREADALIEAIESYLAGELEPVKLDDRLWDTFVAGPELYEAGLAKYQEYADNYEPQLSEWPILAILQDEESLEAHHLVDEDTGHYNREREDRELQTISLFKSFVKIYAAEHESGLEGYLVDTREHLLRRLEELTAFRLGLQAASKVIEIELIQEPWDDLQRGYEAVEQINRFIEIARLEQFPGIDIEPLLSIGQIDISSLEPSERVVKLIQERMGKLLPPDWDKQELEPGPEEDAHEPA